MESVLMRADENEQQAVNYYKLAADQCYADAQKILGLYYVSGDGVDGEDLQQAVKYFQLAADQGGAECQQEL